MYYIHRENKNEKDNIRHLWHFGGGYEFYMYTGRKPGAETESNVFITLFGTRGDSGNQRLYQSKNNKVNFQCGLIIERFLSIHTYYPS